MLLLKFLKRNINVKCGPQLEYKKITEDRFQDVIKHLKNTFFMDEPLNKAVGLCTPCAGNADLEKLCLKTLDENMSQMAVNEKDEIAGVMLNGAAECGYVDKKLEDIEQSCDENFKKIYRFINMANKKADILKKYDIYKMFDMRILSVDERFRGKGISNELVKRSEQLAIAYNFKLMKAEATGIYSQQIFRKNGFFVLEEFVYDQWLDESGNPILPVELPHTKMEVVIKCLNQ